MTQPARPGPRDGSGVMVWPALGVVAALIVYVIQLALPGVHNGDNVIYFVVAGALLGLLVHLWRRKVER